MQDQLNILIIDDEPSIRITLAEILEDEGYNVIVAEDGYKGITITEKTNVDIAFIDMKMPGINGIDTFKEIKRISPDTTIFFMTAFLDEDTSNKAANLGAQAIHYKPLDIESILRILKEDLAKTTILVVDDEFSIRDMLQKTLEGKGHMVSAAKDGYSAIQMVKKTHFDIIFLDIVMPKIDGFRTLEEIKKIDTKTKIVIMSGRNFEDFTTDNAILQKAFAHITKPIDFERLLQLTIDATKKN